MKVNIKQAFTSFIGWPLSILALFFIARTFLPKLQEILHLLNSLNIFLLTIGIFSFLGYYFIRSIIWQIILKTSGYSINYKNTAFSWAISEFKRYIPGNIWSFVGKSVAFSEKGINKRHLAKGMLVEMQIIFLGCVLVSLLSLPFVIEYFLFDLRNISNLSSIVSILAAVGSVLYIYQHKYINLLPKQLKNILNYVLPMHSAAVHLQLLALGAAAVFFFGSGYYFSIASIITMDPRLVLTLSGFFSLSFLIGLLSFITPTGLGVREGSITLGLSRLFPLNIAGFASIFGRLILIVSELLFIFLSFIFSRIKDIYAMKIINFTSRYKYEIILGAGILIFCLYFSAVNVLRHENFYSGRFDLGNMDQTVWNTAHGRIFQLTDPDGTQIVSRTAVHADYILIFLAPLYWLWESPNMLVILQAVIAGLGAVFVYRLVRTVIMENGEWRKENLKLLALVISLSYLLNPALQWTVMYDFHAVTLATTFLLGAFYFLYTRHYRWFLVFAVLAGLTKEHVWIVVGLMGLYMAFGSLFSVTGFQNFVYQFSVFRLFNIRKNARHVSNRKAQAKFNKKLIFSGLLIFLISLVFFYYLFWHAIPGAAINNKHIALAYFNEDTDGTSGLLKSIIMTPSLTLGKLLQEERILYLKQLFTPVGYLPVLAPWFLLFASADFGLNLLADKAELRQIYYQYSAVITPFIYISIIFAISYLRRFVPKLPLTALVIYLLFFMVRSSQLYSPLPWSRHANIGMLVKPRQDRVYFEEHLKMIPASASVSATNNLGAHLSHREYIFTLPIGIDTADYVAFLASEDSPKRELQWIEQVRNDNKYKLELEKDGFFIFKKIK